MIRVTARVTKGNKLRVTGYSDRLLIIRMEKDLSSGTTEFLTGSSGPKELQEAKLHHDCQGRVLDSVCSPRMQAVRRTGDLSRVFNQCCSCAANVSGRCLTGGMPVSETVTVHCSEWESSLPLWLKPMSEAPQNGVHILCAGRRPPGDLVNLWLECWFSDKEGRWATYDMGETEYLTENEVSGLTGWIPVPDFFRVKNS